MISKSTWKTYSRKEEIVQAGKSLDDVLVIHEGEACAYKTDYDAKGELKFKKEMYRYKGRGRNGCVVGGTALIDPRKTGNSYPHSVVSELDETIVVSWNREELKQLMKENPMVESAFVHTMYIDLIQGLRRHRGEVFENNVEPSISLEQDDSVDDGMVETNAKEWKLEMENIEKLPGERYRKHTKVQNMLQIYMHLLEDAIDDDDDSDSKGMVLDPQKKRIARMFAFDKGISLAQHVRAVHSLSWSRHEWQDGIKEEYTRSVVVEKVEQVVVPKVCVEEMGKKEEVRLLPKEGSGCE